MRSRASIASPVWARPSAISVMVGGALLATVLAGDAHHAHAGRDRRGSAAPGRQPADDERRPASSGCG